MNATTPAHPPSQARPGDTWNAGAGQRTTHAHTIPNRPIARNQPRDGTTSLIHGFRLSQTAQGAPRAATSARGARASTPTRAQYSSSQAFASNRVNKINARKEFFYATPEEVLDALKATMGEIVEYTAEAEAVTLTHAYAAGANRRTFCS